MIIHFLNLYYKLKYSILIQSDIGDKNLLFYIRMVEARKDFMCCVSRDDGSNFSNGYRSRKLARRPDFKF